MASKAAKRAQKRRSASVGRKSIQGADRYPGGQIRQVGKAEKESDIMGTVINARQRVFGLSKEEAALPEAGHVIGRLLRENNFAMSAQQGADMKAAALEFHERRFALDRAMDFRRLGTATNYVDGRGGTPGGQGDEPEYVAACNAAKRAYEPLRRAILECGDPQAMNALEMVVLEDRMPHSEMMMGALRCGLNAIHRVMRNRRAGT